MSRKSRLQFALFATAAVLMSALVGQAFGQVQRTYDNSSANPPSPTPNEEWFDRTNWVGDTFAGLAFKPDMTTLAGGGAATDLAFFGNPAVGFPVDDAISMDSGTVERLLLGGLSFNSSTTAYQIRALGAADLTMQVGGLNIDTTTGALIGTGSRVFVVAENSSQNVTFGEAGSTKLRFELNTSGNQGEMFVGTGKTLTFNSIISGSSTSKGLTKTGAGVLLLTGSNSYTGETIVNAGTLRASASDRIASGALTVDGSTAVFDIQGFADSVGGVSLRGNGTLFGTGTLTGTSYAFVSGTASLNLAGGSAVLTKTDASGIVTITGTNTYGGGTTLTAGTIRAGSNAAFGSGSIAINGGKISSNGTNARAFSNDYTIGGDAELGDAVDSGALTFSGAGTLTGNRTLTINSAVTLSAVVGESGGARGLTKNGAGSLTLSGSNTYTGGTTVTAGSLILGSSERLANTGAVTVSGGTFDISAFDETVGAVTLNSGSIGGTIGTLTGSSYSVQSGSVTAKLGGAGIALTKTTGGTVTLSGANSYTGGTTVTGGTLALGGSNVLADSGAVTVNGGTIAIAGNSDTVGAVTLTSGSITGSGGTLTGSSYALASGNISANLGGSGAVTKTTAGLVTLSGTSSTVGAVNVSEGTLELATGAALNAGLVTVSNAATLDIDGTLTAPSGVNVNAGGTLKGAGTIAGNVNLDGILAPGNSPGTLSITGNLNLTSSSVLNFELNETNTVAGSNINDLVAITGDLVLDGTLNVPDPSTLLTWTTSGTDLAPIKWTLFTFTGTLTNNGLTLGNLPTLQSGNSIPQLWQLNIVQNGGGGGSVNLQAVPEPSAAMLIGGVLAGAACLRRRRVA